MSEETKLEYLYRGLKASLMEKIYPLRPRTCAEFLAKVKIYTEASMIANRKGWTAKAIDIKLKATTVANIAVEADEDRIQKLVLDLMETVKELQSQQATHEISTEEED